MSSWGKSKPSRDRRAPKNTSASSSRIPSSQTANNTPSRTSLSVVNSQSAAAVMQSSEPQRGSSPPQGNLQSQHLGHPLSQTPRQPSQQNDTPTYKHISFGDVMRQHRTWYDTPPRSNDPQVTQSIPRVILQSTPSASTADSSAGQPTLDVSRPPIVPLATKFPAAPVVSQAAEIASETSSNVSQTATHGPQPHIDSHPLDAPRMTPSAPQPATIANQRHDAASSTDEHSYPAQAPDVSQSAPKASQPASILRDDPTPLAPHSGSATVTTWIQEHPDRQSKKKNKKNKKIAQTQEPRPSEPGRLSNDASSIPPTVIASAQTRPPPMLASLPSSTPLANPWKGIGLPTPVMASTTGNTHTPWHWELCPTHSDPAMAQPHIRLDRHLFPRSTTQDPTRPMHPEVMPPRYLMTSYWDLLQWLIYTHDLPPLDQALRMSHPVFSQQVVVRDPGSGRPPPPHIGETTVGVHPSSASAAMSWFPGGPTGLNYNYLPPGPSIHRDNDSMPGPSSMPGTSNSGRGQR